MENAKRPLSQTELVALLAMLTATVAFSIDAMLPALPEIGTTLSPENINRAQLTISSFFLGLGVGTFFAGPLSDAYGRKTIAVIGAVIYTLAALYAATATALDAFLIARFVQGVGASGPRVVSMAIVRDLFSGRRMAQILSYVIFVFTLAPVFAPTIGWLIALAFGWRAIFISFAVFSIISMTWLVLRQEETLRAENRRPFRPRKLLSGTIEVFSNRQVVLAIAAQTLVFGCLFSFLMSSQQIFTDVFAKGDTFPFWFGVMGLLSAFSNLINARIVVTLGMREVVRRAFMAQGGLSLLFLVSQLSGLFPGPLFFPFALLWMISIFYLAGFGMGNLNALAMEPLGHMAGLGASIITATATILGGLIAVPVGLAFDGTMLPLTISILGMVAGALVLVTKLTDTATAD